MTGEEAMVRYSGLRLPRDFLCVLEKDGGILLADKALATLQVHSIATTYEPQKSGLNREVVMVKINCLGHKQAVFIERWSLDTSGLYREVVSGYKVPMPLAC